MKEIVIKGLTQNNLRNISLSIPKNKITVFTGVSGSGKSSIVFDTIAAEASRQMNETYPAFIRNRMPKHEKPQAELIANLSPAVIVDQSSLGAHARSTVGTSSELYTGLRLLFSRIGQPYVGAASCFSFNDPIGMCPECGGMGKITDIHIEAIIDKSKSLDQGAITDSSFRVGSWYWRQYAQSGLFDVHKPISEYTVEEYNLLRYGSVRKDGEKENEKIEGLYYLYKRRYLTREIAELSSHQKDKSAKLISQTLCPLCQGKRLSRDALGCWINGYNIAQMCDMELPELRKTLQEIDSPYVNTLIDSLVAGLTRMIDMGLPYLNLSRDTGSLSGGEAQRLKLVRYLGSGLTDMMYIFDEPSTGLHPRDVYRMNQLLIELRDRGNTVLVVEHDKDVISIADEVIDVGPLAGSKGGTIMFQGSYESLLIQDTLTAKAMSKKIEVKKNPRTPTGFLPIKGAALHNLKNIDVDIPTGVICVITGVAGSGKSSLISGEFAAEYEDKVVKIDQSPITATGRSTPASFLGFFDEIRKLFALENSVSDGLFSFNSAGACPVCHGKGVIVTELVYMDPVVTQCDACGGSRYSKEALSYTYKGQNILDVLSMTAAQAEDFFENKKILKGVHALCEVGLSYLTLGQPLSTLSGGERQRMKLAKHLSKKGSIYILDEPTTGLHPSDCEKLMVLFESFVNRGNTVLIIEHNLDVMKQADYIIDIGPDGGKNGGELVFAGTPEQMLTHSQTITAKCLRMSMRDDRNDESGTKQLNIQSAKFDTELRIEEQYEPDTEKNDKMKEDEAMEQMKLMPIGRVVNKEDGCYLALDRKYLPAMQGLEEGTYVQVLWWFDKCDNEKDRNALTCKKPYVEGPDILGTFSTRSPQRPNPIAVTNAQIIWMDLENVLIGISFIDALNGTPILDIKPYTPSLDRVESPKTPNWCSNWPKSVEKSGDFDWEKVFNFTR